MSNPEDALKVGEALKKASDWKKLDSVFPTKDDEWREAYDLIDTLDSEVRRLQAANERLGGALGHCKKYLIDGVGQEDEDFPLDQVLAALSENPK